VQSRSLFEGNLPEREKDVLIEGIHATFAHFWIDVKNSSIRRVRAGLALAAKAARFRGAEAGFA
jgi:hypothetical protein